MRSGTKSFRRGAAGIAALAAVCSLALAAGAAAQPPDFVAQMPPGEGAPGPGEGAGQLNSPRAIAGDPDTGHVYVAELGNSRISEYTAWGLFVKAWGWGVADGAAALQSCGPTEPQEAPPQGLCRKGSEGAGAGQLSVPIGVAVDGAGAVYVFERDNLRVQKFSPEGEFLLMFGGEVNKTSGEDVCTRADLEAGDECGAGVGGEEPGHFGTLSVADYIAHSPAANAIVVGDKGRIQVFNLDGSHREDIAFEGPLAAFAGQSVNGLDVDAAGNIYFSLEDVEDAFKIGPGGEPLSPGEPGESAFEAQVPLGVAVDVEGSVYVLDDPLHILPDTEARVVKYDAAGKRLVPTEAEAAEERFFPYVPYQGPWIGGIATNICAGSDPPGNLYIAYYPSAATSASYVEAYGSGPTGCEEAPERPPHIVAQYATAVGNDSARLAAEINPRFWANTTYQVEYGTGKCSESGCPAKAPVPAALLTEKVVNRALKSAAVALPGLLPNTTYNYRFVAQSGGGGPVLGEGGGEEIAPGVYREVGGEGSFTTFKSPGPKAPCPNDELRRGAAAQLPDCRAYELVSPLDKAGGDVALWTGKNAKHPIFFEIHQSAPSGERFTYSSAYAFADPQAAPYVSQYMAVRGGGGGWESASISPPRSEPPIQVDNFSNEFDGFSADLCQGWLRHNSVAPLSGGGVPGYANLYRRDNCGESPLYEALSTVQPPTRAAEDFSARAQVTSADGSHVAFLANDKLHPDAPTPLATELLLYESSPAGLRFVCYLPGNIPSPLPCGAGSRAGLVVGSARNAISADGQRIFWTDVTNGAAGQNAPAPGRIYVRIGGTQTRHISRTLTGDAAWYWTAARDGSKVIFAFDEGPREGWLYEFDVDTQTPRLIAKGVAGPMGASEDANRIYLASSQDLDGAAPGSAGANNLYLYESAEVAGAPTFTFIMALAGDDLNGTFEAPAPVDPQTPERAAAVSSDGLHAAFSALAPPPSGYDNRDAATGERAQEVYRYDAAAGELRCLSCNPSGARPAAVELGDRGTYAAAQLQGWEQPLRAPHSLSADGSRVFFESREALVPRDTNGTWDVYQWEEPGKGNCTQGDPAYGEAAGGCVDLISAGTSAAKSTFLDADASGESVFFSTQSSLVGADPGLNDVYVARVGGGFPEAGQEPPCEGEACQGPSAPPQPPTAASGAYRGPGNVAAGRDCAAIAKRARRLSRAARALRRRGLETESRRRARAAKRQATRLKHCRRAAR